jgi:hypothetical protein
MNKEIIWSKDEDIWDHAPEDKSEVLQEIYDSCEEGLQVGTIIYYGHRVQPNRVFIDADEVIEMIGNAACDNGGDWAWDYPDVSAEQKKELQDFLVKWQEQFTPEWYEVKNVQEYVVTEEDLKEVTVYE